MDNYSCLGTGEYAQNIIEGQVHNLYFADDRNRLHAASTSVGSGKTRAAISYMLGSQKAHRNLIYVAPTIKLVEQTEANLKKELSMTGLSVRNIELIHSQRTRDGEGVTEAALNHINGAIPDVGAVVIMTTVSFLSILSRIQNKSAWHIILDEAFSPLEFIKYRLGTEDMEKGKQYFESLFSTDNARDNAVTPAQGKAGLVQRVAAGDWKHAGTKYQGMQKLAQCVLNNALKVELAYKHADKYVFATWVMPGHFSDFAEAIFMSALFEQSILYHLWRSLYSVEFKSHDYFYEAIERNTHESQGPLVSIGHLLHESDFASKYNLQRNHKTGASFEEEAGSRVVDRMIEIAAVFFKGRPYLLQSNNWTGYKTVLRDKLPPNARLIPTIAHGLNDYLDCQCVAAFAVTNPEPSQKDWLMRRVGLTEADVYQAYRIHTVYQACGRSAIRDWENDKPVIFLTTGRDDACFLHKLFVGSTFLGQVGDLPRYSKEKVNLAENPQYHSLRREYKRLKVRQSRGVATSSDLDGLNEIAMKLATLKCDKATKETLLG